MKKIAISIAAGVGVLYILYCSMALIVNYEGIYQKFHKKILEAGYEVKAESIDVVRFPVPRIELGNVTIANLLTAKKLEIKFSLLATMMFNPTIKNIKATNLTLNVKKSELDFMNHSYIVSEVLKIVPKLPEITAHNISMIDKNTRNMEHINNIMVNPSSSTQLQINWNNKSSTKLSYENIEGGINVQINSGGEFYSLKLSETYKDGILQNGALRYSIENLQKFVADRYRDVDLLITKIQSPEPAEISCKIETKGNKTHISNITLQSKSISMTGNIEIYNSQKSDSFNLSFDFIDLKTLLASPNMDIVNESKNKEQLALDDVVRQINITAKKIALADATISDLTLNASIDKKQLTINECRADISDGGEFNLKGLVTQNQYRSLFDGTIDLKHKNLNILLTKFGFADLASGKDTNFVLTSGVKATPIDYQLNNLFIKMGSFNTDGTVSVKFIGNTPRINLALNLSALDLLSSEHAVLSKLVSYFKSLSEDMSSKEYLKKYIALREVNYLGNIDIAFNDLIIHDKEIDKLRIITDVSPGNIVVNSLYYQDVNNYLTGSGHLQAAGIKPEIEFKVSEAMLETSNFDIPNILQFFQSLQSNYDLDKVNIKTALNIQSVKQKNLNFSDIIFDAANDGILLNISALKGKFEEGAFDSSGSLRTDSMNMNLSYAYNDFSLKGLSAILPFTLFGIEEGWMSSNGMISTSGANLNELFYNLYTKSSFLAKKVKWNNFNIDELISATNNIKYQPSKLENDVSYYMNNGSTVMNTLSGDLELNHGLFKFTNVKFDTDRIAGSSVVDFNIYNNNIIHNSIFSFQPPAVSVYNTPGPVSFTMSVTNDIMHPKKTFGTQEYKKYVDNKAAR